MNKNTIAVILPTLNEEKNIKRVLDVVLETEGIDEIIVVDGGSTDKTPQIAKEMGVKVLILEKKGKGEAMWHGVKNTKAEIIVFLDSDLIGFSKDHILSLIQPILNNEAMMTVGIRERWFNLPEILAKIDPLLAIGGERALKRIIFERIPKKFIRGFMIETALNYYCRLNKLPVKYVKLKGLNVLVKEEKMGLIKGFLARIKMIFQILKIRISIFFYRKEFLKNN